MTILAMMTVPYQYLFPSSRVTNTCYLVPSTNSDEFLLLVPVGYTNTNLVPSTNSDDGY